MQLGYEILNAIQLIINSVQTNLHFNSRSIATLHLGPNFRIAHTPQELAQAINATIVNSHPLPTASIIGWATIPTHSSAC